MNNLPPVIDSEEMLDNLLSTPYPELINMMSRLKGDIIILGVAGKMGLTLGRMAVRATKAAGVKRRIIGVARFSNPETKTIAENFGIETIACDLLDRKAIEQLPLAENIIYMAGRKFGTGNGGEALTWAMNVVIPTHVTDIFRNSRIVAFSTGCVYPLRTITEGGCTEDVQPDPVGEYAQSCLGRERIFQYGSQAHGTKSCLYRLNYAIDMRYGVLHDIAMSIIENREINLEVSHFNLIWQGDANNRALLCLEQCNNPATPLNVTGTENISVRDIAGFFGKAFGKDVRYKGSEENARMYLSNAQKSIELFGEPTVTVEQMLNWTVDWIKRGGKDLGKPTHFEVNDGKY